MRAKWAAHKSWQNTEDRTARTNHGRAGLNQKFLDENGGDPLRAEAARKAFFAELSFKSARARRLRAGGDAA